MPLAAVLMVLAVIGLSRSACAPGRGSRHGLLVWSERQWAAQNLRGDGVSSSRPKRRFDIGLWGSTWPTGRSEEIDFPAKPASKLDTIIPLSILAALTAVTIFILIVAL